MNKNKKNPGTLPIVGWRETVALPDLNVSFIKAKVDTGARSSSIHAFDMKTYKKEDQDWVQFEIHPNQRNSKDEVLVNVPVLEYRRVRSSNGTSAMRPVILTHIALMGFTWEIELTLANRDEMGFRMLLGREAVRGRFLVDAGGSFYGEKAVKKNKGASK